MLFWSETFKAPHPLSESWGLRMVHSPQLFIPNSCYNCASRGTKLAIYLCDFCGLQCSLLSFIMDTSHFIQTSGKHYVPQHVTPQPSALPALESNSLNPFSVCLLHLLHVTIWYAFPSKALFACFSSIQVCELTSRDSSCNPCSIEHYAWNIIKSPQSLGWT